MWNGTKMRRGSVLLGAIALGTLVSASVAHAAAYGDDNEQNYSPTTGSVWGGGSGNGGFGWNGNWTYNPSSNTGNAGYFTASSFNNDFGDSGNVNINSANGNAWGLYANSGNAAQATRVFGDGAPTPGVGTMDPGQTFSVKLDNGNLDNGSAVGFGLQNAAGTNRFEFFFVGGASSYQLSSTTGGGSGGADRSTGSPDSGASFGFTRGGLQIFFTLKAGNKADIAVTKLTGNQTAIFTNFPLVNGADISQVRLFYYNTGGGGDSNKDVYFNNVSVPEPASLGVFGLAVLGTLRRRRKWSA